MEFYSKFVQCSSHNNGWFCSSESWMTHNSLCFADPIVPVFRWYYSKEYASSGFWKKKRNVCVFPLECSDFPHLRAVLEAQTRRADVNVFRCKKNTLLPRWRPEQFSDESKHRKLAFLKPDRLSTFPSESVCEIKTFYWEEMKPLVLKFGDPFTCGLNVLRCESIFFYVQVVKKIFYQMLNKNTHPLQVLVNCLFVRKLQAKCPTDHYYLFKYYFLSLFLLFIFTNWASPECASWLAEWPDSSRCKGGISTL